MDTYWLKQLPLSSIQHVTPVRGGDVNQAYRIDTQNKRYFLLVQPGRGKAFFESEIAGLNAFHQANITAPTVIASGTIQGDGFLLLSYLEEGDGKQSDLGELVAHLHQHHQSEGLFGFSHPYTGSDVSFDNQWCHSWTTLFVERRLDHLRQELLTHTLWDASDDLEYQQVRTHIVHTLDNHPSEPSLLHGDLWSGNYMFLTDGRPALFDPACLYGDREFDIGITTVFGGFGHDFYSAYHEAYPLLPGYESRLEFYRLYYLMVHLRKFGATYYHSVKRSMSNILASATSS